MTDQHSKHVLGAYGNDIVRTPNLDASADHAIRMQWAKAVRPVGPSQAMGPPPPDTENNISLL